MLATASALATTGTDRSVLVTNIAKNPKDLSAVRAKDPLRNFGNYLWKTWRSLNFPDPSRIAYDVADYMVTGGDRLIVMGFRGMAKSYIAITKGLHEVYIDPEEAMVLTTSATTRGATLNSYFALQMLNNFDWLAHLRPPPDKRQGTNSFDVRGASPKKSESFASISLFGQLTSRRASLSIPDDIETPDTSDTEAARMELRKRHAEIPGAIIIPGGREIMLGTAQNEMSIYPELATEKGYAMRMWPSEYPKPDEMKKFGPWLSPMIVSDLATNQGLAGLPTEPSRFPIEVLLQKERDFGRTEYARQFKLHLDAGSGNAAPLHLRDIPVIEWATPSVQPNGQVALLLPAEVRWGPSKDNLIGPEVKVDALHGDALHGPLHVSPPADWLPVEVTWMYVDPSGAGLDETVSVVGAGLSAIAFICALEATIEGHTEETLRSIAVLAKLWAVGYIYVESNFGQGMFAALLRPFLTEISHACTIEEDRKGTVQKERRIIETLEPATSAHRVVMNLPIFRNDFKAASHEKVEEAKRRFYRLTYQMTRITKVRGCIAHDDRVDGLASLVAKFAERMRQRTQDALANDKERLFLAEIQEIIKARIEQGLPTYGAELMPGMGLGGDPLRLGGRVTSTLGRPRGRDGSSLG